MSRLTRIAFTLLLAALLVMQPVLAVAAPPEWTAETILQDDFNSGTASWALEPFNPAADPPSPGTWGLITGRRRGLTGSGLWAGGTVFSGSWLFPTASTLGSYPNHLRGSATRAIDLSEYYSATAQFYYSLPSIGQEDEFRAGWVRGIKMDAVSQFPSTAMNGWSSKTLNLTDPASVANLSRFSGSLVFEFFNWAEGPEQPIIGGEGPTVDDLKVSGFRYGPVRSLAAAQVGTTEDIRLTWSTPLASTIPGAEADTRDLAYRVWRSPASSVPRVWTQLTGANGVPARLSSASLTDTTSVYGTSYVYVVQACDPNVGNNWPGEVCTEVAGQALNPGVTPQPSLSFSVSADKSTVTAGGSVTFTYTIHNTGNVALTNVRVSTGTAPFAAAPTTAVLGNGQSVTWTETETLNSSFSTSFRAYGTYGTEHSSNAVPVAVTVTTKPTYVPPSRIAGNDRFSTAVAISQQGFKDAASVGNAIVVANGYGWADALPASSLAGAVSGPLILVGKESVPDSVKNEIRRLKTLGVTTAYVVGGDAVVGSGARKALAGLGLALVRVEGANRYETASAVAEKTRALRAGGTTGGTVFVATGLDFPDALAASSLAAALRGPILLTTPASLPPATLKGLQNVKPARIVICGGTSAVSGSVADKLKASFPSAEVVRKSGAGRYDTAKAIIDYGKTISGVPAPAGIFLATGSNYPDALAGGVLAGIGLGQWTPLMLTTPTALCKQAESFIVANRTSLDWATVLGGPVSVSESVKVKAVTLAK